jgi:hypothetical protein
VKAPLGILFGELGQRAAELGDEDQVGFVERPAHNLARDVARLQRNARTEPIEQFIAIAKRHLEGRTNESVKNAFKRQRAALVAARGLEEIQISDKTPAFDPK